MPTGRVEIRRLLGEDPEGFVRQNILDDLATMHSLTDAELLGPDPEPLRMFFEASTSLRIKLKLFRKCFVEKQKIDGWRAELLWLAKRIKPYLSTVAARDALKNVVEISILPGLTKSQVRVLANATKKLDKNIDIAANQSHEAVQYALLSSRKKAFFKSANSGLLNAILKPTQLERLETQLLRQMDSRGQTLKKLIGDIHRSKNQIAATELANKKLVTLWVLSSTMGLVTNELRNQKTYTQELLTTLKLKKSFGSESNQLQFSGRERLALSKAVEESAALIKLKIAKPQ